MNEYSFPALDTNQAPWGRGQRHDGIYSFVHYHSMIHEALGIARGNARVQLGGP